MYKKIIGMLLAVVLIFQFMSYHIYADDSGFGDNIQPVFEPKVMVESYRFSKETIYAGKEVTVWITLLNTSTTSAVKNMMVTAEIDSEYMQLTRYTDSIYIPFIGAGGRTEIKYNFETLATTPTGQYDLMLTMDYADKDGNTYNAQGKVKVTVSQKAKIKFDPLIINSEAEIGDAIEASVNAMNMGHEKLCNVRAKIKADGLTPKGTIFIGDIEAGQMGTGSVQVLVGGLTKGETEYGETTGKVTYYYEDEAGTKKKIKENFTLNIMPLSMINEEVEEDKTDQWWIIMGVIIGFICIFSIYGTICLIKRKKAIENEMVE